MVQQKCADLNEARDDRVMGCSGVICTICKQGGRLPLLSTRPAVTLPGPTAWLQHANHSAIEPPLLIDEAHFVLSTFWLSVLTIFPFGTCGTLIPCKCPFLRSSKFQNATTNRLRVTDKNLFNHLRWSDVIRTTKFFDYVGRNDWHD